jgi:hypothetical protein
MVLPGALMRADEENDTAAAKASRSLFSSEAAAP